MRLQFLGTGAGRPSKTRNVTSVALCLSEPGNEIWLFDAGEGTQQRLLFTPMKLGKLKRIFVTHLHGDHLYGLPGLLSSRTYVDGACPLTVYGPPGIREYLETVFRISGAHLNYLLDIVETQEGLLFEDERFTVEAAELEHRIQSFGYRIAEKPRPGKLDIEKLVKLGVPPGPLFGKLKKGGDVELGDGRLVRSEDVVGTPEKGRIVAILGDTRPCGNAVALANDADLLVHEATFAGGLEEKATAYGHSTVLQAAAIASKASAKRLVFTHISSRYGDEEVARMVETARLVFPNADAAADYAEFAIPLK